jgi:hypothetical protein
MPCVPDLGSVCESLRSPAGLRKASLRPLLTHRLDCVGLCSRLVTGVAAFPPIQYKESCDCDAPGTLLAPL